jgi:hypothetical protein
MVVSANRIQPTQPVGRRLSSRAGNGRPLPHSHPAKARQAEGIVTGADLLHTGRSSVVATTIRLTCGFLRLSLPSSKAAAGTTILGTWRHPQRRIPACRSGAPAFPRPSSPRPRPNGSSPTHHALTDRRPTTALTAGPQRDLAVSVTISGSAISTSRPARSRRERRRSRGRRCTTGRSRSPGTARRRPGRAR